MLLLPEDTLDRAKMFGEDLGLGRSEFKTARAVIGNLVRMMGPIMEIRLGSIKLGETERKKGPG